MAILATAQWWVRAGGNVLNGGGFDAQIAGAGTNYCDQDAAQLSLTDLATPGAGSTTLTSATGGFTAAMVGNCWRIPTGTNFAAGYYFVTGYTDTNTVTLDRSPTPGGAGSGGTGRLGGAWSSVWCNLCTAGDGSVTAPSVTSPLAPGHQINLRGGGGNDPGTADYTQVGYAVYPSGTATDPITLVGYNGRPRIDTSSITLHNMAFWNIKNTVFVATAATFAAYGLVSGLTGVMFINCKFDQAGYDKLGASGHGTIGCEFVNTGSTSAGSYYAFSVYQYGGVMVGTIISNWRGGGILTAGLAGFSADRCIVYNTKAGHGLLLSYLYTNSDYEVNNCAFVGNAGDGIRVDTALTVARGAIFNNIVSGNAGYGIKCVVGTATENDRRNYLIDYNAFYNNTSGARSGISAGVHDVTLSADPFTNAAGGDYSLNSTAGGGADLKGVAFPTSIP